MECLIVGGGIGGLAAALSLHAAGIPVRVVEAAVELTALGVGINLLPHATRELFELGLEGPLESTGVETSELVFCSSSGVAIRREPRGRAAGYRWPQYSIHRGALQMILLEAVRARLGAGAVRTGLRLERFERFEDRVEAELVEVATGRRVKETADVLVGADGLHSAVRAQLHPGEGAPLWNGVHMWRGAAEIPPFLTGRSMVAAIEPSGRSRLVAYPIAAAAVKEGCALVNWVAEVKLGGALESPPDWRHPGKLDDLRPHYAGWKFPWLDIAAMFEETPSIWWYPMVDRDPLASWGAGRVTLLGDAAHPMYPIGSNGGSQAIIDGRVLAWNLARADDPAAALAAYEQARREPTGALVLANRDRGPLKPGQYKRVAGMEVDALNQQPSWTVQR